MFWVILHNQTPWHPMLQIVLKVLISGADGLRCWPLTSLSCHQPCLKFSTWRGWSSLSSGSSLKGFASLFFPEFHFITGLSRWAVNNLQHSYLFIHFMLETTWVSHVVCCPSCHRHVLKSCCFSFQWWLHLIAAEENLLSGDTPKLLW